MRFSLFTNEHFDCVLFTCEQFDCILFTSEQFIIEQFTSEQLFCLTMKCIVLHLGMNAMHCILQVGTVYLRRVQL
jgi:hypothetical protein